MNYSCARSLGSSDCEVAVFDAHGNVARWVSPSVVAFGRDPEISAELKRSHVLNSWEGKLSDDKRFMTCRLCATPRDILVLNASGGLLSHAWICHTILCPYIQ